MNTLLSILYLVIGSALRFLLPYLIVSFETVAKSGKWSDWPPFEPHYLSAFILNVVGYGVTLATIPGAWASLIAMAPVGIIALAYAGQDLSRKLIKTVQKRT